MGFCRIVSVKGMLFGECWCKVAPLAILKLGRCRGNQNGCKEKKMVKEKEKPREIEEGIDWWNDFGSEVGKIGYEEEDENNEDTENGG